ncbi:MAG: GAF domain-containing protein [Pirellulaceae bacterium]
MVDVASANDALVAIGNEHFDGVYLSLDSLELRDDLIQLQQGGAMLRDMPDGIALLSESHEILWANRRLVEWSHKDSVIGLRFYEALDNPEIMGPDFCPFHTALATGFPINTTLHTASNHYFQVHAAPLRSTGTSRNLIVTVSDVTEEILQQQKLAAIHSAGRELADIRPDEIFHMDVHQRIDLLKSNIHHYLKDLLNFDVVEVRLLEQSTGELEPLFSVGIDQAAADRKLQAMPKGNGVTGYVAATGESYLCEDVLVDPLYIQGVEGARSSLTAPLMLHDQVLGTINIESPEPRAFSESDIQFLEIFARDVAHALNTLELLMAQKANTAQQSCEAIHSAVALPVDQILNDAVNVLEQYIGHESDLAERVKRILKNARDIKQTIQQIGERLTPMEAVPPSAKKPQYPTLMDKRVLVVDADTQVLDDAHMLLERYGCIVETAQCGNEAVQMVRCSSGDVSYDAIISDIRLPDYSGYQLMLRLKEQMDHVPMILMTGFGYDPGHSIVKARQDGLHPKAILYKPFRLDQLIDVLETILEATPASR